MKRYIKLVGGFQPKEITLEELIEEFPDVDFCDPYFQDTMDAKLAEHNVYELHHSDKPRLPGEYVEGPPLFMQESGIWIENWITKTKTPWDK